MKIAIIGSRGATDNNYNLIIDNIPKNVTEIISGGAIGADSLAKRFALEHKLIYTEFAPDYASFGKMATIIRNNQIVNCAEYVLCLWDGKSKGTKNVISLCLNLNKPCKVIPL